MTKSIATIIAAFVAGALAASSLFTVTNAQTSGRSSADIKFTDQERAIARFIYANCVAVITEDDKKLDDAKFAGVITPGAVGKPIKCNSN